MWSRSINVSFLTLLFLLPISQCQTITGELGDADQVTDNPMGAAYVALFPSMQGKPEGSIAAVSAGEDGVEFAVNIENLPTEGGPFSYHLHVDPIPSDGNCTGALAHLDPYIRGEVTPCQSDRPETCQVGDLAGKHGRMNSTSFQASFTDPYASLKEGIGAFFGNRSVVIHFANKTRLACANFTTLEQAIDEAPDMQDMQDLRNNASEVGVSLPDMLQMTGAGASGFAGGIAAAWWGRILVVGMAMALWF